MFLLLLLLSAVAAHSYDATFAFPSLQANNGWLYLDSFHFSPHLAKMQLTLSVQGSALSTAAQSVIIQGIPASEWEAEEQLKCGSLLKMPVVMQELRMDGGETAGIFQFAVPAKESYHFVLKDCHQMLMKEYDNSNLSLRIRMKVLSN
jgi:hypothetical protein